MTDDWQCAWYRFAGKGNACGCDEARLFCPVPVAGLEQERQAATARTQAQPAGPVHAVRGTVTPQRDFGTSAGEVYPGSRPVSSVEDLAPATSVQQ